MATTFVPDSRRIACPSACSASGRVVDLDDDRARLQPSRASIRARHDDAGRALLDRRLCEFRAVEPFAANRDEQIAGRQRACIDRHAVEFLRRISRDQRRAHRSGDPPSPSAAGRVLRTRRHTTPEFVRRRDSASRATATSSNGSTRSPITVLPRRRQGRLRPRGGSGTSIGGPQATLEKASKSGAKKVSGFCGGGAPPARPPPAAPPPPAVSSPENAKAPPVVAAPPARTSPAPRRTRPRRSRRRSPAPQSPPRRSRRHKASRWWRAA